MAFSMVDAYIMQVEKMSNIVEIRSFMRKAEQTFLERVQENKKPKVKNMLVEDTKKYDYIILADVLEHLSDPAFRSFNLARLNTCDCIV